MGGQACILYGAAEFSRDVDLAVLADESNLAALSRALSELQAEPVYFPELNVDALSRGHACHFRCHAAGCDGIRLDVMSTMRGCEPFERLWKRRRRVKTAALGPVEMLSLPDLVQAKKTQRDKDWPMIRRLIESDYANRGPKPKRDQIQFWLSEARTPGLLVELCRNHPRAARRLAAMRPALEAALEGDLALIETALYDEERQCRAIDREFWMPLRQELNKMKRESRGKRKA
jgi:hypothetical protein